MAALLSLRNVISEAEGSAMRTQIVLSAAGMGHLFWHGQAFPGPQ